MLASSSFSCYHHLHRPSPQFMAIHPQAPLPSPEGCGPVTVAFDEGKCGVREDEGEDNGVDGTSRKRATTTFVAYVRPSFSPATNAHTSNLPSSTFPRQRRGPTAHGNEGGQHRGRAAQRRRSTPDDNDGTRTSQQGCPTSTRGHEHCSRAAHNNVGSPTSAFDTGDRVQNISDQKSSKFYLFMNLHKSNGLIKDQ